MSHDCMWCMCAHLAWRKKATVPLQTACRAACHGAMPRRCGVRLRGNGAGQLTTRWMAAGDALLHAAQRRGMVLGALSPRRPGPVCVCCACAPAVRVRQCSNPLSAPLSKAMSFLAHVVCSSFCRRLFGLCLWLAACLPACLAARSPVSRINTLAWWLVCATCSSTGARGKSQGRGGAGQPGAGDAWQPLWQLVGRLECWASLCANAVHCVARIQCNVLRVAGVECVACCRCLSSPCVCPRPRDGVGRELERLLPASADLLERLVPASADLSASVAWSSVSRSWTWTR
jgi:hypothetical protein